MYESHFGFQKRPFTATPNVECFFPTENSKKAFDSVVSCIERASGAALIVGGSGLGKSLLLQVIGRHFQQGYSVAILESASITSRRELLQSILFELGLPYRGMEEGELRLTLMDYLKPSDRCPNGLLLCVDEAHLLQTKLLEELKMITNLVRDGSPRARLVLAGNATIEERLTDPKLESLNQRIALRAYLHPMSQQECANYVGASLNHVGRKTDEVFDDQAVEAVHTATNGIPRLVNQVCDHAFVLAIAEGKDRITKEIVNEAWSDIQRLPVQWHVLGAETESKNEHVIEFGSLNSEPAEPTNPEITSDTNDGAFEYSFEENFTGETNVVEEVADAAEPEKALFVFRGPENPFVENFEEEELIVDAFSQVIGHSPKKPNLPQKFAESKTFSIQAEPADNHSDLNQTVESIESDAVSSDELCDQEASRSIEIPASELSVNEPTADENGTADEGIVAADQATINVTPVAQVSDEPKPAADSAAPTENKVAQHHDDFQIELQKPKPTPLVSTNSEPSVAVTPVEPVASEPTAVRALSAEESLKEYFSQNSDSITFGVGQGIYADSFVLPRNESEQQNDASPAPENNLPADKVTGDNLPGNIAVSPEAAAGDPACDSMENQISQAVENIKQDIQSVSGVESLQAEPSNSDPNTDDRDMIIVEDEPVSAIQSVPMKEVTGATGTAKREDYQKLFDRLRKG